MGSALMKGVLSASSGALLGFSGPNKAKAEVLATALGGKVFDSNARAVQEGDFVFLAVKPQILKEVLKEISSAVKEKLSSIVLVSMAAGWSIEKIQAALGCKAPVVRIMPNTPSLIGQGVIVMAASSEVSAEKQAELRKLLSGAGIVDSIEEKYLEAATGLSGCGPAFAYLFIEALADGGVRSGLPREKALRYAAQTVLGSAAMVLETGKHPGELKDMVTSPAGATIEGIAALENGGFRACAINAVEAASRRAADLG